MKRFSAFSRLSLLTLLAVLAACSRVPAPGSDTAADLEPLTFGSAGFDEALGLAKHSTGVYAVGSTNGDLHRANQGESDAFVRRYEANGALLWGKQFGTPGPDSAQSVASDGNNNAYVVGTTSGSLAGSRGGSDVFVRKYTPSGKVSWTRQFGSSTFDQGNGVAVFGSSVYVVGYTLGSIAGSQGGYDAFIRKYTAKGNVAWTRQFGTSDVDLAEDVAVDGSGNAYVVGSTSGSLTGVNGGGVDMFIRKYSPSGSIIWTRQLHYSDFDGAEAVAINGNSVYVVGGWWYLNDSRNLDVRLIKYDTGGNQLFDLSFGTASDDYVRDVSADSSSVIFGGETYSSFAGTFLGGLADGYIFKYDPNGLYLWGKQVGTSATDVTRAVLARSNSQVYIAGATTGALDGIQSGSADAYLRQLRSSDGSTVWTDQ